MAKYKKDGDGDGFVDDGLPTMRPFNPLTDLGPGDAFKPGDKLNDKSKVKANEPPKPPETTKLMSVRDAAKTAPGQKVAARVSQGSKMKNFPPGTWVDIEYKNEDYGWITTVRPNGKKRRDAIPWKNFDAVADAGFKGDDQPASLPADPDAPKAAKKLATPGMPTGPEPPKPPSLSQNIDDKMGGTDWDPAAKTTSAPLVGAKLNLPDPKAKGTSDNGVKKVGTQAGSNPGALFEVTDPAKLGGLDKGDRLYIKRAKSPDHVRQEKTANDLYAAAGVPVPDVFLNDDASAIGSKIVSDNPTSLAQGLNDEAVAAQIREGFLIDAWLGNWDVAGLGLDNIVVADGVPYRIDAGGALAYRAQGGKKGNAWGPTVIEVDTLRDPKKNPQAAQVFGSITDDELAASAAKLAAISDDDIRAIVVGNGLPVSLADTLIARKADILAKYPPKASTPEQPDADVPELSPAYAKLADDLNVQSGELEDLGIPPLTEPMSSQDPAAFAEDYDADQLDTLIVLLAEHKWTHQKALMELDPASPGAEEHKTAIANADALHAAFNAKLDTLEPGDTPDELPAPTKELAQLAVDNPEAVGEAIAKVWMSPSNNGIADQIKAGQFDFGTYFGADNESQAQEVLEEAQAIINGDGPPGDAPEVDEGAELLKSYMDVQSTFGSTPIGGDYSEYTDVDELQTKLDTANELKRLATALSEQPDFTPQGKQKYANYAKTWDDEIAGIEAQLAKLEPGGGDTPDAEFTDVVSMVEKAEWAMTDMLDSYGLIDDLGTVDSDGYADLLPDQLDELVEQIDGYEAAVNAYLNDPETANIDKSATKAELAKWTAERAKIQALNGDTPTGDEPPGEQPEFNPVAYGIKKSMAMGAMGTFHDTSDPAAKLAAAKEARDAYKDLAANPADKYDKAMWDAQVAALDSVIADLEADIPSGDAPEVPAGWEGADPDELPGSPGWNDTEGQLIAATTGASFDDPHPWNELANFYDDAALYYQAIGDSDNQYLMLDKKHEAEAFAEAADDAQFAKFDEAEALAENDAGFAAAVIAALWGGNADVDSILGELEDGTFEWNETNFEGDDLNKFLNSMKSGMFPEGAEPPGPAAGTGAIVPVPESWPANVPAPTAVDLPTLNSPEWNELAKQLSAPQIEGTATAEQLNTIAAMQIVLHNSLGTPEKPSWYLESAIGAMQDAASKNGGMPPAPYTLDTPNTPDVPSAAVSQFPDGVDEWWPSNVPLPDVTITDATVGSSQWADVLEQKWQIVENADASDAEKADAWLHIATMNMWEAEMLAAPNVKAGWRENAALAVKEAQKLGWTPDSTAAPETPGDIADTPGASWPDGTPKATILPGTVNASLPDDWPDGLPIPPAIDLTADAGSPAFSKSMVKQMSDPSPEGFAAAAAMKLMLADDLIMADEDDDALQAQQDAAELMQKAVDAGWGAATPSAPTIVDGAPAIVEASDPKDIAAVALSAPGEKIAVRVGANSKMKNFPKGTWVDVEYKNEDYAWITTIRPNGKKRRDAIPWKNFDAHTVAGYKGDGTGPQSPDQPAVPNAPDQPAVPDTPNAPSAPDVPEAPEAAPAAPSALGTPPPAQPTMHASLDDSQLTAKTVDLSNTISDTAWYKKVVRTSDYNLTSLKNDRAAAELKVALLAAAEQSMTEDGYAPDLVAFVTEMRRRVEGFAGDAPLADLPGSPSAAEKTPTLAQLNLAVKGLGRTKALRSTPEYAAALKRRRDYYMTAGQIADKAGNFDMAKQWRSLGDADHAELLKVAPDTPNWIAQPADWQAFGDGPEAFTIKWAPGRPIPDPTDTANWDAYTADLDSQLDADPKNVPIMRARADAWDAAAKKATGAKKAEYTQNATALRSQADAVQAEIDAEKAAAIAAKKAARAEAAKNDPWGPPPENTLMYAEALDKIDDKPTVGSVLAMDSDGIEGFSVRLRRPKFAFADGEEPVDSLQVHFKVTEAHAATPAFKKFMGDGTSSKLRIRLEDGGVVSRNKYKYESSYDGTTVSKALTLDDGTRVEVRWHNAPSQLALHNMIQIQAEGDLTPAQMDDLMTRLGLATGYPDDASVAAYKENVVNKLLNPRGTRSASAVAKQAKQLGITPENITLEAVGGRIVPLLTEEVAHKLGTETNTAGFSAHFYYDIMPGGNHELTPAQWADMLTDVGLLSTVSRWTEGVNTGGMSPGADLGTGGADYVFTRQQSAGHSLGAPGFIVDGNKALRRLDWLAYPSDSYGVQSPDNSGYGHKFPKDNIKNLASRTNSGRETVFRKQVPISDLQNVVLPSDLRTKVIAELKARGVTEINGVPIDQFIATSAKVQPLTAPAAGAAGGPPAV